MDNIPTNNLAQSNATNLSQIENSPNNIPDKSSIFQVIKRLLLIISGFILLFSLIFFSIQIFIPILLLSAFGTEQSAFEAHLIYLGIPTIIGLTVLTIYLHFIVSFHWLKSFLISFALSLTILVTLYYLYIPFFFSTVGDKLWRTPENATKEEKVLFDQTKINNVSLKLEVPNNCGFCREDKKVKHFVLDFDFNTPFEGEYNFRITLTIAGTNKDEIVYFHRLDPEHPNGDYNTFLSKGNSRLTFVADPVILLNTRASGKYDFLLSVDGKNSPTSSEYRLLSREKIYTSENINWYDYYAQEARIVISTINLVKKPTVKELGYLELDTYVIKKGQFKYYGEGEIVYNETVTNLDNQEIIVPSKPVRFQFSKTDSLDPGEQKIIIPLKNSVDSRQMDNFYLNKFTYCSELRCVDADMKKIGVIK